MDIIIRVYKGLLIGDVILSSANLVEITGDIGLRQTNYPLTLQKDAG